MAMLGEQFMVGGEICGAVVSVRFQVMYFIMIINNFFLCIMFLIGGLSIVME